MIFTKKKFVSIATALIVSLGMYITIEASQTCRGSQIVIARQAQADIKNTVITFEGSISGYVEASNSNIIWEGVPEIAFQEISSEIFGEGSYLVTTTFNDGSVRKTPVGYVSGLAHVSPYYITIGKLEDHNTADEHSSYQVFRNYMSCLI